MRLAIPMFSLGFLAVYGHPHKDEGNRQLADGPFDGELHFELEGGNMDRTEQMSRGMPTRTPFFSMTV